MLLVRRVSTFWNRMVTTLQFILQRMIIGKFPEVDVEGVKQVR